MGAGDEPALTPDGRSKRRAGKGEVQSMKTAKVRSEDDIRHLLKDLAEELKLSTNEPISTRDMGRHERALSYCAKCERRVRSLPRHNRRHHGKAK